MRTAIGALALAALASASLHAATNLPPRLVLDLTDGSRVIGSPAAQNLRLVTAYAKLDLPFGQIRSVEFRADKETAAVELRSGDRLSGVADVKGFELDTLFGKAAVDLRLVRRFEVRPGSRGGAPGLTLWCTFDSRAQVEECRAGPGGTCRGGAFEAGKFGGAFAARFDEMNKIAFPRDVVNPEQGCIEFWARLSDFPSDLAWGQNPTLLWIAEDGRAPLMLHLNGNDGGGFGGLCASMTGMGRAATGQFGQWTYDRAIGSPDVGGWHHYALVWNVKGIRGVDNGARKLAVFVDGALNSRCWTDGDGRVEPFTYGEFSLMFQQHLRGGRVLYDNLKVWSFDKTDFSDRLEE